MPHVVSVRLRLPMERDRAELLALRTASRAQLQPWEPAPAPGTDTCGDEWFDRIVATCNTAARVRWLVCDAKTGKIAASVGVDQIYRGPFNNGILGWWCGTPYVNRGYMTAGVRAAIEASFRAEPLGLGLHRLEANIRPENAASIAVARKANLRREGFSPRYLQINGRYCDHIRYAIVREDWEFLNRACRLSI